MTLRILNLDNSVIHQKRLCEQYRPDVVDLAEWGPRLRMGCSFARFREFEDHLHRLRLEPADVTFVGSGDFHHVTLALLRQVREPFVLVMLDNHPDWMSSMPFMHCGTWLRHALDFPLLQRVVHLGGNTDFDNGFRWFAPAGEIRDRKVVVVPGRASFRRGFWRSIQTTPLLDDGASHVDADRLEKLFNELTPLVAGKAVYVTFDKDVLTANDAPVNWDSGCLRLTNALEILHGLIDACGARLIGMDVVGDYSPVRTRGLFRWALHHLEHPRLSIDEADATLGNEDANLAVVQLLERFSSDQPTGSAPRHVAIP